MGTLSALDAAPRITRKVSAWPIDGTATTDIAKLAIAALMKLLHVTVTCLSDHASFSGSFLPVLMRPCPETTIIARINAL